MMKCSQEQLGGQCLCVYKHKCLHTYKQIVVICSESEQGYVGKIRQKGRKGTYFPRSLLFLCVTRDFALLILHLF